MPRWRKTGFGLFSCKKKSEVSAGFRFSSAENMGNFLCIKHKYAETKNTALASLRYFKNDNGALLPEVNDTEVIDVDDSDEKKQYDSSVEEGILGWKNWAEECFVPLNEEEECEIANALHNSRRTKVLVVHENSNIDINGEKLQCLRPRAWLNDEVINLYFHLLKEREDREPERFLKCHFFNTFFYKNLISGDGYKSVRRWTTQSKLGYTLLDCDKVFVPIHQQNHWCLAVINNKERKFQYLDSRRGVDHLVMDVLACYYVDEVKDKNGEDINVSSWEREFVSDLPEQENGYDCGVFMIKYVDFYSRDIGLCFRQEHMPYFRNRTLNEILKLRAD